jgi:hypothetical protein
MDSLADLIDRKRKEIEATGLCQWEYAMPAGQNDEPRKDEARCTRCSAHLPLGANKCPNCDLPLPGHASIEEREFLLQFFEYAHLPESLQEISKQFFELAHQLILLLPRNQERTVALRKLLESKDCAVRARIAGSQRPQFPPNRVIKEGSIPPV